MRVRVETRRAGRRQCRLVRRRDGETHLNACFRQVGGIGRSDFYGCRIALGDGVSGLRCSDESESVAVGGDGDDMRREGSDAVAHRKRVAGNRRKRDVECLIGFGGAVFKRGDGEFNARSVRRNSENAAGGSRNGAAA